MIELAVLGLLKESELHGYELKKRLRDVLGPLSSVSFGSLYPALARLEAAGMVKAVEAADTAPAFPMTGSFAGEAAAFRTARRLSRRGPRGKKVYGITEDGERRLVELLAGPADDDRTFALQLVFCRFSEPDIRLRILRQRKVALEARLHERRHTIGNHGDRLDRYTRTLIEHDTESTERDIEWITRLIETEEETPA
ncbi:MAG TPA: PadR family transcriptional regulator [Acidimicrobiales bacterium]